MSTHPAHHQSIAAFLHRVGASAHAVGFPGPDGLTEVGMWGALPCWAAPHDPSHVLPLARRLARQGEPGLLIGASNSITQLLLGVTITPVRLVTCDPADRAALPLLRLARATPGSSRLGAAMACAAALDVDAAGRRAFRALRSGITHAVGALPLQVPEDTRHAWVLLQVTRLLFLRFVESEGWLAGRSAFLAEEFDRCLLRGAHPERQLLAPLFFGTLNRPLAMRSRHAREFGSIPFLNGGLFEPHPVEQRRRWMLPVAAWQHLFALLIESFEVTLDHGEVGDRVSPELLGRVFEGMMAPEERKAAGTFYTPTELVPALLRAAISSHLAPRLNRPEEAIERDLTDRDPVLDAALRSLHILDPAVGSGAFLVGALGIICDSEHRTAARVRQAITRRLFGVDRNPVAVRLTELRLWLELLRTMRGRTVGQVSPLPNLDTSVRAGDALHDPFAGLRLPDRIANRLARARRRAASSHGVEHRAAIQALRKAELRAASAGLKQRIAHLQEAIADLIDQGHGTDLFGTRGTLRADTQVRVSAMRRELRSLRRERARLRHDAAAAAFGIEAAFAPVLTRGGFDLVVGNPPWVRGERLSPRERAALGNRYRWWRGGGQGWQHSPDLAVAFVERAHELLAPGGTMALLLPGKLATTGYAVRCRAALAHHDTLHVVADLGRDPRATFDATTYPLALVASKRRADDHHAVALDLARIEHCPQSEWRDAPTWSLATPALQQIARRLGALPTLRQSCTPALGVKTGANHAFVDPPAVLAAWTRPAIRGRDVRALCARPGVQLLWPADARGTPWRTLPAPVLRHLQEHRSVLEHRSDQLSGAWWQLFRAHTATAPWRVAWSDLAPALRAAPLHDPAAVPLNSCYVVSLPDERSMLACAAWLNATAIGALARSVAEPAANGFARFGARAVGSVPMPPGVLRDPVLADLGGSTWSTDVTRAIDDCVARWLRLTDAQRRVLHAIVPPGR